MVFVGHRMPSPFCRVELGEIRAHPGEVREREQIYNENAKDDKAPQKCWRFWWKFRKTLQKTKVLRKSTKNIGNVLIFTKNNRLTEPCSVPTDFTKNLRKSTKSH